jgi:transposase
VTTAPAPLPDLRTTLVVAVEVSKTAWVIAAHVPGLHGAKVKQRLGPRADALLGAIARLKQRAADRGGAVERTVAAYESGYSGFWLARVLGRAGIEAQVIQPVSVPVDRRARRAKTMPSTSTSCCGPAWPSCAASPGSAPWCRCPTRRTRTPAIPGASARN